MSDRPARLAWFKSAILPHEAALRKRVRRMATMPGVEIDDVVSEVLLRAYTTENFTRIDRGAAFLFTIARNFMADLARHRSVVQFEIMANIESLEVPDAAPTPEVSAVARDELRRLQEFVQTLSKPIREVFLLRRIEDLSMHDIAVRLGLSVSTVEKHLAKAMAILTRAMSEGDPVQTEKGKRSWRRAQE